MVEELKSRADNIYNNHIIQHGSNPYKQKLFEDLVKKVGENGYKQGKSLDECVNVIIIGLDHISEMFTERMRDLRRHGKMRYQFYVENHGFPSRMNSVGYKSFAKGMKDIICFVSVTKDYVKAIECIDFNLERMKNTKMEGTDLNAILN